jgi:hypothetical protein
MQLPTLNNIIIPGLGVGTQKPPIDISYTLLGSSFIVQNLIQR